MELHGGSFMEAMGLNEMAGRKVARNGGKLQSVHVAVDNTLRVEREQHAWKSFPAIFINLLLKVYLIGNIFTSYK